MVSALVFNGGMGDGSISDRQRGMGDGSISDDRDKQKDKINAGSIWANDEAVTTLPPFFSSLLITILTPNTSVKHKYINIFVGHLIVHEAL